MHEAVLADEAFHWLNVRADGIYVDCTVGAGGHSARIAERLTTGHLIALDRDVEALALAGQRLSRYPTVTLLHGNYRDLTEVLKSQGISWVDGVLLDAGVSSMQLDTPERGFSFQQEGPLDMRMDATQGPSAADYLAAVSEDELARVLKEYGDVGPARRIAAAILRRQRSYEGLTSTGDLVRAIQEALPFVQGVPSEVRTVFQAIRIAVNDELRGLECGVNQAIDCLAPGGRFVGIAFHSGEDRIVKNVLRNASRACRDLYPDGRVRQVTPPRVKVLTPKPVEASAAEVRRNPRAHSARLRAAQRLEVQSAE